ncbi:hypothetical protein DFH07DRAFT_960129 [Mycena maculata]|uniref:Uncharacterized protein n=1 Tax=Mycena maculata TaxID=230809 RepID=A0AAD7NAJ0_9AGAR|nr:hypothetical protein DFH07DRAFT_960129 [Mycena maculata]
MVNPFPPVLPANTPHGLIDALDAHTRRNVPVPLPLDPRRADVAVRCTSDRVEGLSSGPPYTHSCRRAHRLRLLTPVDMPAPMLGFGLGIWLLPGAGAGEEGQAEGERECEELLLSPEGIGDGTVRRSRGTPPVVWCESGPEVGRSRSLSGTAMLRGSPLLHLIPSPRPSPAAITSYQKWGEDLQ